MSEPNDAYVVYNSHIQDIGWQGYVSSNAISGTTGLSKRMEAIKIGYVNYGGITGGIEYSAHVQNIGWQSFVANDAVAGTTGQSLRLEAIKIRLTGTAAAFYDVYYQCHVQNIGWMGWAKNGEEAGTTGYAYRCEAIRISLVFKNDPAPGSAEDRFRVNPNPLYPVLRFPVNYVDVTTRFSSAHYGVDFGHTDSYSETNPDLIVAPCDMTIYESSSGLSQGNYVSAIVPNYMEGHDLRMRFCHLKDGTRIGTGFVTEGTPIGAMGQTGNDCDGIHLHCDCWHMSAGEPMFQWSDYNRSVYSRDPLTIFHLKSEQIVNPTTDATYTILRG